jgi:hypothetical protein
VPPVTRTTFSFMLSISTRNYQPVPLSPMRLVLLSKTNQVAQLNLFALVGA